MRLKRQPQEVLGIASFIWVHSRDTRGQSLIGAYLPVHSFAGSYGVIPVVCRILAAVAGYRI